MKTIFSSFVVMALSTLGAAASNVSTNSWDNVGGDGVVLSQTENVTMPKAPYVKITSAGPNDGWLARTNGVPPVWRMFHTAVWTGREMIVWGGLTITLTPLNDGGRYNPVANTWTPMTSVGAPAGRWNHTAVWTGTEMIIWGGVVPRGVQDGGRYDPVKDKWSPVTKSGAPFDREDHTAIWTGTEMIVWGGITGLAARDGGRYNPTTDSWIIMTTAGAPGGRSKHSAVWTGTEMIVWGGLQGIQTSFYWNDGGRYDPANNSWSAVTTANAPSARFRHTMVSMGNEMIIWGGQNGDYNAGTLLNSGGRYNLAGDNWSTLPIAAAPAARSGHTAVWTGNEMIVWGGSGGGRDGARYNPVANSWTSVTTANAPSARRNHTAIWTGREMIVWGGDNSDSTAWSYFPNGPILRMFLTSTNRAVVAWPVWSTPFTLQQNSNLASGTWLSVTNPASVVGAENQVIVPPPTGNRFFQLQYP